MHFADFSSHAVPSCEIGAHSETHKMYNVASPIKVHQSLAPPQKAAVTGPNGHTGTGAQGEGSASTNTATKIDVDGSIPFFKKKQLILYIYIFLLLFCLKLTRRSVLVLVACGTPGC